MRSVAATALLGAVIAAVVGLEGEPLACVATGLCDGAPVSRGPIAQPMNAWSALALAGVGLMTMRGRDTPIGIAMTVSAIGALWYHASLTTWSGVIDAAGVAAIAVAVAVREWARPHRVAVTTIGGAVTVATAAITGLLDATTAAAAILGAAGIGRHLGERTISTLLASGTLFGAGLVFWSTGHHAFWHVTAALGVGALVVHMRSSRIPVSPLRSAYQGDTT